MIEIVPPAKVLHGRDTSALDASLHLMVNINEDRDQAFQEATTFLASYYGTGAVSRAGGVSEAELRVEITPGLRQLQRNAEISGSRMQVGLKLFQYL